MSNIWVVSDTHFSHANILRFQAPDWTQPCSEECQKVGHYGHPQCNMRPFDTVAEMDETMIQNWNTVVKPSDKVYHLGDVTMDKHALDLIMPRLYGHKRLVRGNHDTFQTNVYMRYFEQIFGTRLFENMLFSHIPVHPMSIGTRWTNVHGHTHNNTPPLHFGKQYLNVCVEWTNYRPLAIEEVRQLIRKQQ